MRLRRTTRSLRVERAMNGDLIRPLRNSVKVLPLSPPKLREKLREVLDPGSLWVRDRNPDGEIDPHENRATTVGLTGQPSKQRRGIIHLLRRRNSIHASFQPSARHPTLLR